MRHRVSSAVTLSTTVRESPRIGSGRPLRQTESCKNKQTNKQRVPEDIGSPAAWVATSAHDRSTAAQDAA